MSICGNSGTEARNSAGGSGRLISCSAMSSIQPAMLEQWSAVRSRSVSMSDHTNPAVMEQPPCCIRRICLVPSLKFSSEDQVALDYRQIQETFGTDFYYAYAKQEDFKRFFKEMKLRKKA